MAMKLLKAGFDKYMVMQKLNLLKIERKTFGEPNRLYTPLGHRRLDYEKDLGFPGEYPLPWCTTYYVSCGPFLDHAYVCWFLHCGRTNKRYQRTSWLTVAAVLSRCIRPPPTQIGYDSTDPMAEGGW